MPPWASKRGCARTGCPGFAERGRSLCPTHDSAAEKARDQERGSAASRGYGAQWRELRKLVLHRDPVCRCGCGRPSTDVDHIKPKSEGGTDSLDNLQGLTHECHSRKTAREDGRWGKHSRGTP